MVTIAILTGTPATINKIMDLMGNPSVHFIFLDSNIFVHRYLAKRGFRRCTIYCLAGHTPKMNIGKYEWVAQGSSYIELEEVLKELACDVV